MRETPGVTPRTPGVTPNPPTPNRGSGAITEPGRHHPRPSGPRVRIPPGAARPLGAARSGPSGPPIGQSRRRPTFPRPPRCHRIYFSHGDSLLRTLRHFSNAGRLKEASKFLVFNGWGGLKQAGAEQPPWARCLLFPLKNTRKSFYLGVPGINFVHFPREKVLLRR